MFARLFAVAALVGFAVVNAGECSTGTLTCCDSTFPTSDLHNALSQFGINVLADVEGLLSGSGCSPLSVVGVGANGASCSQDPICCNDNTFNGVSVGCSPVGLNL